MSQFALKRVHLDTLTVSPLNPRKTIHPESIMEMANSILEQGILQPPVCRPRPAPESGLELLYGQRRLHASYMAVAEAATQDLPAKYPDQALPDGTLPTRREQELLWLPVLVRDISDTEAEEMMIVENLHREDVSPREEAEGYARLLDLLGEDGGKLYTIESLAAKLGKSRRYLSRRLRLRLVPERLWEALEAGMVSTRHLELVGGLPHPKTREEVAKKILEPKLQDHPLTVAQAQELIREKYVVSLKGCGFDQDDATLLALEYKNDERILGGACVDCPYRTGNDPELKEELMQIGGDKRTGRGGIDPNLCTNTRCFTEKQEAVWRRMKAHAEEGGTRVLDVDRTEKIFRSWGDQSVMPDSGLVDLSESPGYEATGNHASEDEAETWGELINGTEATAKIILARHPVTKKVHRLLEMDTAIKAAEKKLKQEKRPNIFSNRPTRKTRQASDHDAKEFERERQERALEQKVREQSYAVLRERLADALNDATVKSGKHAVWQTLVKVAFFVSVFEDRINTLDLLGVTEDEAGDAGDQQELWHLCESKVQALASGGNELPVIALLLTQTLFMYYTPANEIPLVAEVAAALKIDLDEVKQAAERAVKGEQEKPQAPEPVIQVCHSKEDFAARLMELDVKPTTPNENGVFTGSTNVVFKKGKCQCAVKLACNEQGQWFTGYAYEGKSIEKFNSGCGGANVEFPHATRRAAVLDRLQMLIDHLEKPYASLIEDLKDVRHAVEQSGAESSSSEPTLEDQVKRILAGESYVDVLGKTPKKGTPEHKEHEKKRVSLVRAVKAAK